MRNALYAAIVLVGIAHAQDNRYCSPANVWIGNTSDGPAALPQRCLNTALANTPSPGAVVPLAAGQNLQTAYNTISCGTTLLLAHGASWDAPFNFSAKGCDDQHWITIKSDGNLPPEGTRVTAANQAELAVFSFAPGKPPATLGDHLRFIGIAWTKKAGAQLVAFATGNGAKYIIFDRNRMLGNPKEETRRGFTLNNGQYVAVIDSDFEEFHCIAVTGSCIDSQAISGGVGTGIPASGPFKIVNNFLEAAAENILFGGGPADGCGPNDVEIRRNYLYKPQAWNPNDPNFIGVKYIVKNLFELKNGCRILLEGNVMENSWGGFTQVGFGILSGPKSQAGPNGTNLCSLCTITDLVIRYSKISNVAAWAAIDSGPNDDGGWSQGQHRVSIHDLVADGIQYATCFACSTNLGQLASAYITANPPPPQEIMSDVLINHITQVSRLSLATGAVPLAWLSVRGVPKSNSTNTPTLENISYLNSISLAGIFGMSASAGGADNCAVMPAGSGRSTPLRIVNACYFGSSKFSGNAFITAGSQRPLPADWPAGNLFVADWSTIQFVNYSGSIGGDYHLMLTSPVHAKALDGRDPGADIDMVNLFTNGVQ